MEHVRPDGTYGRSYSVMIPKECYKVKECKMKLKAFAVLDRSYKDKGEYI